MEPLCSLQREGAQFAGAHAGRTSLGVTRTRYVEMGCGAPESSRTKLTPTPLSSLHQDFRALSTSLEASFLVGTVMVLETAPLAFL